MLDLTPPYGITFLRNGNKSGAGTTYVGPKSAAQLETEVSTIDSKQQSNLIDKRQFFPTS